MLPASLFFVVLLQADLLLSADSFCFNNGNYTTNDTYAKNLDSALSSLPTNIGNRGFYNISVGSHNSSDTANAAALCKGDAQLDECRDCIEVLTARLRTECPNQRQAAEWKDECIIRYSDETLLDTIATPLPGSIAFNPQDVQNPTAFMADLGPHLRSVREQAAKGGPLRKVGYGNTMVNDFQYIFSMVMCFPDLSSQDCRSCLISAAEQIPICCYAKKGVSVQLIGCRIRYETYHFYNETRLLEFSMPVSTPAPQPPLAPQPPQPPPPPGNYC